ncbi:MAG: DsrE family protein [Vicinamibacterales bacterium]
MQTMPSSMRHAAGALAVLVTVTAGLSAQGAPAAPARLSGPVIEPWGGTFEVPPGSLMPPTNADIKVKFDVGSPNDDPAKVNAKIDQVARFLNMNARAGVPRERLKVALVMHTTAAKDALGNAGYRSRYGVDNPNLPLLEALGRAGARIYVCGQSAASRGLKFDEIAPPAKVALSAMNAHAILASEGYSTNPF